MNQWEQAIVERTEAALRQTEPYLEKEEWETPPDENFQLSYILTKGDPAEPKTILAIAICEDETFLFYPLKPGGGDIADWPPVSDYDTVLFENLGNGFDLTMMTLETHWFVWNELSDWYGSGAETECPEGLRKYLDTCMKNGVTRQVLKESFGYDGMDVMELRGTLELSSEENAANRHTPEIGGM
ncbi:MAG: hypothetical protein HFE92_09800 [Acutalibacter muris]|nr:hypothetical protein [Acutalibacter muris]